MDGILFQAFVYLCAAVIAVPIAKRLGLGSVLGYLIAGIAIGPVLGIVGNETQTLQHFAEFGVVMMLFLVGLELEPKMLWAMRTRLLGLGGLQLFATTALVAAAGLLLGAAWNIAIAVGLIFALSSTAIVLQTLSEKSLDKTEGGRASFSVLLFQDIAVIPILAIIPLLASANLTEVVATKTEAAHGGAAWAAGLPGWGYALLVLGAIGIVVLGGHYLTRPLFQFVAAARIREIFTATALLLVIGIALLMTLVGLSPALGTFIAGVVLADSEFRHELESDIAPFKGLLLGLFFITVGAGIDFVVLGNQFVTVIALTALVILIKGGVLYGLGRYFKLAPSDNWLMTLGLAQAGEFGFVLLGFSLQNGVIPDPIFRTLSLVVALSMLLTPVLFIFYDRWIIPRMEQNEQRAADTIDEQGMVVIAGSGRFGQIVNRLLVASGITTVVLDHDAGQIDNLRKFGVKSYFGDATRPDLLLAAGIAEAQLLVIAIDDRTRAVEMVELVKRHYPQIRIMARAYDVGHLYLLKQAGVDFAIRETFDSALGMGKAVLRELGTHPFRVEKMARAFTTHDEESLKQLYKLWDEDSDIFRNRAFQATAKDRADMLQQVMQLDRSEKHDRTDRGWTPPPKGFETILFKTSKDDAADHSGHIQDTAPDSND